MLNAKDLRRKINESLKGKSEVEQIGIIEGYIQEWPSNVRGEYVRMRRHLVRRLNKLRTRSLTRATSGSLSNAPFVIAKSGHLTVVLVGLPNVGKSYVFHRLGGDGATIADYPFATVIPAVHLASLDNLRIQTIDLPPLVEGTIASLPYGEKLTQIVSLADVLCIVLDASGDTEVQELILADELNSIGIKTEGMAVLVLNNRVKYAADFSPMTEGSILAGTRVGLRSKRDFDCVLSQIARAGGYISTIAKPPGRSLDQANRLWVKDGTTVRDLAASVHKELARRLIGGRVWGESARQPGQKVSADHLLADGDVVELLAQ